MKKIISFLLLLVSLNSFAQLVPDSIANKQVTISLKLKHHAFIIGLMPGKGSTDAIKYLNQVAKAVTGSVVDTSLNVSVTVPYRLVANLYLIIGSQQERISSVDNSEIKAALIPQLPTDLLQAIGAIAAANGAETEDIRNQGKAFILSIK